MGGLSASDLIRISEAAQGQRPLDQALTILRAGFPEADGESLADLAIHDRDCRLFELREQTLGARLQGRAECPQCRASLEFEICTTDFPDAGASGKAEHTFESDGVRVTFHVPTSRDVAAVAGVSPQEGRRRLAERCIVKIDREGAAASLEEFADDLIEKTASRLCEVAPRAETLVNVACPACTFRWKIMLDIGSFFATEIEALARRLLLEVHTLARAYGWSEREILSLSARRRHAYLELVGYA